MTSATRSGNQEDSRCGAVDNLNFVLRATTTCNAAFSGALGVLTDKDEINNMEEAAEAISHQQSARWTAVMPSELITTSDLCVIAALKGIVTENDFTTDADEINSEVNDTHHDENDRPSSRH